MNFKLAFSVLILTSFLIPVQTAKLALVQDNTGYPQVQVGPGFQPNEINVAYKFYDSNLFLNNTAVVQQWGSNFGNATQVTGSLTQTAISTAQVITIFGSQTQSTKTEVSNVESAVEQGKGLLYLTNSLNSSSSAQQFFDDFFNASVIHFDTNETLGSTFSGSTHYVIATEFNSPLTPVTENLTKVIFPHALGFSINQTALSETNVSIKDIYPIIYDSYSQTTLGIAIEVGNFGRIVILGSSEMFNNEFYSPSGEFTDMSGVSNKQFANNLVNWLGRGSGYFNILSHTLNVPYGTFINRDFVINGTAQLTDSFNQSFTNAEVRFGMALPQQYIDYNYMKNTGNDTYFSSISTRNLAPGYQYNIQIQIVKRGFILQTFYLGRIYVKLEFPGPSLPDLSIIAVLASGVIIFSISTVYIWKEFRKTNLR